MTTPSIQRVGSLLWSLGVLLGLPLLGLLAVRMIPAGTVSSLGVGAVVALGACGLYLQAPLLAVRPAPKPWWCLAMVFLWGAIPAAGFSGLFNEILGAGGGRLLVAPVVEEALKGVAVVGVFVFLRHEFDGVVDGVVYATFVALGFAATENALYYARSWQKEGWEGMTGLFVVRGVLAPWGHPLYTAMFGLGVGYARETSERWRQVLAPLVGFFAAVTVHVLWNGTADFLGNKRMPMETFRIAFPALVSLWLVLLSLFVVFVVRLVRRERSRKQRGSLGCAQ